MKNSYIIVCGFARSGKTTFLAKQPYPVLSTSQVLDRVCTAIIENCIFPSGKSPNALSTYNFLIHKVGLLSGRGGREFKINVAERVMRSILGQDVLARAAIDSVPCDGKVRVIESVGGSELEFIKGQLNASGCSYGVINLRSFSEKPGIDIRELDRDPKAGTLWMTWQDEADLANFLELATFLLSTSD